MDYKSIAIQYANDIINDVIPACGITKKTAVRFLNDLDDDRYYYNKAEVDARIVFAESFDLTEVTPVRKTKLENWQIFYITNIFGIYKKSNKKRKARVVYLEVPRGNAKTQIFVIMALYELLTGYDAQVVIAANTNKQAFEVDFDKAKKLLEQLEDDISDLEEGEKFEDNNLQIYNSSHRIVFKRNKLLITSNESKPIDGLGGSLILIDEMHEMKDLTVYNVLKSSMAKRTDSLMIITTTAGNDTESECYKIRQYMIDILNNVVEDESRLAFIYTIDDKDEDNLIDRKIWAKANPNLNVSVFEDGIEAEVNNALHNPNEKAGVLIKHFNVWLKGNTEDIWLNDDVIINSLDEFDINEEKFVDCEVWIGADLANTSDVTAVSYMWVYDGIHYFQNKYYICEDNNNNNTVKQMFKETATMGYITITQGNITNYDYITEDILKVNETKYIREINYDSFNSPQWAIDSTNRGLILKIYSQTKGNMNKPVKDFEIKIKTNKLKIQKNFITKWMLGNCILTKPDIYGNRSIDKSNNNRKIDGVSAMLTCLGGYLRFYTDDDGSHNVAVF